MEQKNNKRKVAFETVKGLSLLSQLSISFLTPVFLFGFSASRLVNKYGFSKITVVIAVLLGVVVGISSVYGLIKSTYSLNGKGKK